MSEFILHPEALKDLEEIWDCIAADNLDAADQGTRRDLQHDQVSGAVPVYRSHSPRPDTRSLRFQTVCDDVIVYAPDEKPLAIIAILHGRRNPRVIAALLRHRT